MSVPFKALKKLAVALKSRSRSHSRSRNSSGSSAGSVKTAKHKKTTTAASPPEKHGVTLISGKAGVSVAAIGSRKSEAFNVAVKSGSMSCRRSAMSAPLLKKRRSSPVPIKEGVWKKIANVPEHQIARCKTPPSTPTSKDKRFQEFRQKWEAGEKKKSPGGGGRAIEQVLRAGSGGSSDGLSGGVDDRRAPPVGPSPWIEGVTPNPFLQKVPLLPDPVIGGIPVTRVHRISINGSNSGGETTLNKQRPPTALLRNPPQRSKPLISPAKNTSNSQHKMPVSWQKLKNQLPEKRNPPLMKIITPPVPVNVAPSWVTPLDPLVPYPHTSEHKVQLHRHAWDAKVAAQATFGSYMPTNSVLNPILPVLIRLNKPVEKICVKEEIRNRDEQEEQKAIKDEKQNPKNSSELHDVLPLFEPSKDEYEPTFSYGIYSNGKFGVDRNAAASACVSSDIPSDTDEDEDDIPL